MSDYPDYTSLMQIIGCNIMVPIDLQAAYIMMPVDIQAQYVNLEVDIVAQTIGSIDIDIAAQSIGNLAVNLAASAITLDINVASAAVTLNVDITAATIGNLTIDIEAQSVAVYNPPDWASLQGDSVDLTGIAATVNPLTETLIATRNVTAGKTWVIHAFSVMMVQEGGNIAGYIWNDTDNVVVGAGGGAQGFLVTFPKPMRVASGKNVDLLAEHYGASSGGIYGCIYGYEE